MTDETTPSVTETEVLAPPAISHAGKVCANCGAPMLGEYCYACGQPEKGMIRHLASVLSDVADTVFNIDSRVFRSIVPLYFRPGFLTEEYFAGRRTRYVTPFRLFFFLCVIAFFVIQVSVNFDNIVQFDVDVDQQIGVMQVPAEVQEKAASAVAALQATRDTLVNSPRESAKVERKIAQIKKKADERLAYLKARTDAVAAGQAAPKDPDAEGWQFSDSTWDPIANPIKISWLPAFANAKLTDLAKHAVNNVKHWQRDRHQLIASAISVLPQTLFVLMPLFAVLLKIVYIFKRRLYMEHLMVALHSHAFACMSVLLIVLLGLLLGWASTGAPWAVPILKLLRAAAWIWLPVYLFLMQKRIYRQGWIMTTLKYWIVGTCYTVILTLGLIGAALTALTIT